MLQTEKPRGLTAHHVLIVALLVIALAARLIPGQRMVDDAFITFRYARNLVRGAGFAYNPGDRVLGTTTPLYTLLMAGIALATGDLEFPVLALAANALAGAVSTVLVYLLGRRWAGHWAPAAASAILWAVAPYSVTFAIGGMETDLTIALLLAAAYAHLTHRHWTLAVFTALALLARPDTAILLGLLWLDLLLIRRRIPWREGLVTLALLAPWLIFGTLYFGSPIPNSIAAKSAAYRLPPTANLVRLAQHYATPFFEHKVLPPLGIFLLLATYCALSALGGLSAYRRERRTWPLAAYPLAYSAAFALANPLLFRWYLSPPLPFYFLLLLGGAWSLASDFGRIATRAAPQARLLRAIPLTILSILTAAALALTLNAWDLHPDHGPDRPAPEMAWFRLELFYEQAADMVLATAEPNDSLSAGDIGVLGYNTDLHILDTVGLITPEAVHHYPADPSIYVINYAIPADLMLALDPDFIVILEVYGRLDLLPNPRFQARYQLTEKLETNIYGSDGMLIFNRR